MTKEVHRKVGEHGTRSNNSTRQEADPLNIKIPAARLDLRKNFFNVRVCERWNNLPNDIKNSVDVTG
jgi:hypothetical protein